MSAAPSLPANLSLAIGVAARENPDHAAVRCGGLTVSYSDLDALGDRAASALVTAGITKGDRLALMLGNRVSFVVAVYAAWRLGAVVVPINTSLTSPEVAFELTDCQAKAMLVGAPFAATVQALRGTLPELAVVFLTDSSEPVDAGSGMRSWQEVLDAGDAAGLPEVDLHADDLALLAYTSGTAGSPRGAMLSHGQLLANHQQMDDSGMGVAADDVVFTALPLFHSHALNVAMAHTLANHATLELAERFEPEPTLRLIAERQATVVVGAPPMYVAWLHTPGAADIDLTSVRLATSSAAPLPARVLAECAEKLGLSIREIYGMAEAATVVASSVTLPQPISGCVGRPLRGLEVRISEDGRPAAPGDPGVVSVRGPNVFSGYWHAPDSTGQVLDDDGWLDTGDIGLLDDGLLFLVDRAKDVIIVSGFNVYPAEVEDALMAHPQIARAAVLGTTHPYTGEAITAFIVTEAGADLTAEEVTEDLATRLARFKRPTTITFVDALPVLPTGKLRRRMLRDS